MCSGRTSAALLLTAAFVSIPGARADSGATKKLIEFGWDEPGTTFIRHHIAEMEKTPFDGCVFHVDYTRTTNGTGSFTWEVWGGRVFTSNELAQASKDLESTPFHRFTNNFLRFNTTPAKLDWFDDFDAIVNNAELAAGIAHRGKCAGILLDTEQYEGQLFNYRKQRDAAKKSWDDYAGRARLRGRQVMAAFQRGYPDLTVFLTFAYSLPWAECGGKKEKLADAEYGLLAPFLDGLFEGARGKTKIVDGYEMSYAYKQPSEFETAYETVRKKLLPIVADAKSYQKYLSVGFGLWMDQDWRKHGWNTNDFSKNYFSPEAFKASVSAALNRSDEFVWVYTETPRWWSEAGRPEKLPGPYETGLRQAHPASSR